MIFTFEEESLILVNRSGIFLGLNPGMLLKTLGPNRTFWRVKKSLFECSESVSA